ncbi:hypothetical protein [Thalassospira sp. 11-3]|uniref:hypothetical protein n=1 Tax=Thalassospira sp. 11-3 TaxID=2135614 RepID=UPI000D774BBC|nr:hypothetical protein [Thalassospira sp. 11-3]PXX25864.1 hypothetical protein C7967_1188 [Thalassospira sp. 11-3]
MSKKFFEIKHHVIQKRRQQRAAFVEANAFVLKTLSETERYEYLYFGHRLHKIDDFEKCLFEISHRMMTPKKMVQLSDSTVIKDWIHCDLPLSSIKIEDHHST